MTTLPKITFVPMRAVMAGALAVAIPAALALPAAPVAAQADQLDQVVSALRSIGTMKADFVQTDRSGQSVRGELTLKRPGRIRFEYERGVDMLIVSIARSAAAAWSIRFPWAAAGAAGIASAAGTTSASAPARAAPFGRLRVNCAARRNGVRVILGKLVMLRN